jgi:hypothetical protein
MMGYNHYTNFQGKGQEEGEGNFQQDDISAVPESGSQSILPALQKNSPAGEERLF